MATAATLPAALISPAPSGSAGVGFRLDPRTWIVGFVSVAFWASTATSLLAAGVIVALILIVALMLRHRLAKEALRSYAFLCWITIGGLLTVLLYALFGTTEANAGIHVIGLSIKYDAIRLGILMALRLTALLLLSTTLLLSVPALEMAAGLTRFLMPLRRLGIAVANLYYLTFFLSRMIPSLVQESRMIALAQRSRGIGSRSGALRRWREYPARILPVFASALRRSDTMALLFASRGFDARHIPLRVTALKFALSDVLILAALGIAWAVWLYLRLGRA